MHLVGYGPSARTIGANRAGRAAVREIRQLPAETPAVPPGPDGSARPAAGIRGADVPDPRPIDGRAGRAAGYAAGAAAVSPTGTRLSSHARSWA